MPKFRRKPSEIIFEATQFTGQMTITELEAAGGCICLHDGAKANAHVHTIHDGQFVHLEEGDWILPEPDGEHFYPCKPNIFEQNYEEIL